MSIYSIILSVFIIVIMGAAIYLFAKLTEEEQIEKLKEWLLYAVIQAEQEFGSGTGDLKLRMVYDWFIDRFKIMSVFLTFDSFCELVDEALENMKEMLASNEEINSFINNIDI